MPRTKKKFKFDIYYHFLIQIWRLELLTRDNIETAWYRNCATCNHEIGDSRHEDYTNKQHGAFLQLDLDT